jgi:hypothetical protein
VTFWLCSSLDIASFAADLPIYRSRVPAHGLHPSPASVLALEVKQIEASVCGGLTWALRATLEECTRPRSNLEDA